MPALASTRLQAEQEQLRQIEGHLVELEAELKEKLLADADDESVAQLDLEIARFKRKAEHIRLRIDSLNARAAMEAKAAARKQTVELIEREEAIWGERARNGQAITRTIAKLVELMANDVALTKKGMAAWPWDNSSRAALKPFGQGIRELVAYEFYRQSATAWMNEIGDNAITLPGSVCPNPDWRLQPQKIQSLNDRLRDIANHASEVMRRRAGIPKEAEPERKVS
jgi:hypothetical protein